MKSTGPWRHPAQTFKRRQSIAPFVFLIVSLCLIVIFALGATTISRGIATIPNINHGVDQ